MKKLMCLMVGVVLAVSGAMAQAAGKTAAQNNDSHPMFHVVVTGQGAPMILIPGLASTRGAISVTC